jgi:hypothetical protein
VGKLATIIKERMGTESILDFDPEDNNLKEHTRNGQMLKNPIPQNIFVSK